MALRFFEEVDRGAHAIYRNMDLDGMPRLTSQVSEHKKQYLYLLALVSEQGIMPIDIPFATELMDQAKSLQLRKFMQDAAVAEPNGGSNYHRLQRLIRARNAGLTIDSLSPSALEARIDSMQEVFFGGRLPALERTSGAAFEKLRSVAENGTSVISFSMVDSVLFQLAVFPDTTILAWQHLDEDQRELISSFQAGLSNPASRVDNALRLGTLIFSKIPVPRTSSTLIIPDGTLSHIPFEAIEVPHDNEATALLSDLTTIRYEYSIDRIDRKRKSALPGTLFALAPEFAPQSLAPDTDLIAHNDLLASRPNLRASLGPLAHNREEVDALAKRFKGSTITGMYLAKDKVLEGMRNAAVLHFATHAFADQDDPERSAIVISGDVAQPSDQAAADDRSWSSRPNDALLHAWEIQTMPLNAQLAVLSACETAVGREQAGEGVMSLARAFRYAGVDNIVSSLWKVDDAATKEIMVKFYEHLAEGMGKADALAEAKRWYRKENPNAPPSHWAAFILIGDNEPVRLKKRTDGWLLWGAGFAILACIIAIAGYRLKFGNDAMTIE